MPDREESSLNRVEIREDNGHGAAAASSSAEDMETDQYPDVTGAQDQNQVTVSSDRAQSTAAADERNEAAAFKSPDLLSFRMPNTRKVSSSRSNDSNILPSGSESSTNEVTVANVSSENETNTNRSEVKTKTVPPTSHTQPKLKEVPLAYMEPKWGGTCSDDYKFEIIKNGKVIASYDLGTKSYHVFGRLSSCDHMLEHPSLSRHHAVVQYCAETNERHERGWYIYDLESTHGTTVNKVKVKSRVYHRLRVGFMIKFAGSSRLFLLQGPDEDQEKESDLSITEMKEKRQKEKEDAKRREEEEEYEAQQKQKEEDVGCTWGMSMADEPEEPDMDKNPFAIAETKNENLYLEDPKKALKGFFEREGYDPPEYEFTESGFGKHTCRVELPVDLVSTPEGDAIHAEVTVAGKKKEAVVQCALEACRILDRHELLRQANHESRARKKKNWEAQDFYDSDDDTFLDRTGDIEKKRKLRMKMFGHKEEKAKNYDTLKEELELVEKTIAEHEAKLMKAKSDMGSDDTDGVDALDAYMNAIKSGMMDTKTRTALKRELVELRKDQQRLQRLVTITKPVLPENITTNVGSKPGLPSGKKLPMFGKMKGKKTSQLSSSLVASRLAPASTQNILQPLKDGGNDDDEPEEEEEDAEDELDAGDVKNTNKAEETVTKVKHDNTESDASTVKVEQSGMRTVTSSGDSVTNFTVVKSDDLSTKDATQSTSLTAAVSDVSCDISDSTPNAEVDKDRSDEAASSHRVLGPSMPPVPPREPSSATKLPTDTSPEPQKKKRRRSHHKPTTELSKTYCEDDPHYATWLPPTDQAGDGKTHLNAKFGY